MLALPAKGRSSPEALVVLHLAGRTQLRCWAATAPELPPGKPKCPSHAGGPGKLHSSQKLEPSPRQRSRRAAEDEGVGERP